MRNAQLALSLALTLAGCAAGGIGTDDLSASPNDAAAPPPDLAAPSDAAVDGDGATGFCAGATARALVGGALVEPVAVTSSRLVLDCCEGALVRFHLEPQVGAPVAVAIREFGGQLHAGTFALEQLPQGLSATLLVGSDLVPGATLSGTLGIAVPAAPEDPTRISLCASVTAAGHALDGARLHVEGFPVMPYSAEPRVELRLLKDRSIGAAQAQAAPIASLELEDPALVDLLSIGWYERATHSVFWDNLGNSTALRNRVGAVPTRGTPFVVIVDGARLFVGAFFTLLSSESFAGPVVLIENLRDAGFTLAPGYPERVLQPDPREAPALLAALAATGKLK